MSHTDLLTRPASSAEQPGRSGLRIIAVVGAVAAAGAVAFLAAAPMGIDLAAQTAYGDFWLRHGAAALDFGWYGGISPFGYKPGDPRVNGVAGRRLGRGPSA